MFSPSVSGVLMGSAAELHEQLEAVAKTPFLFPPGGLNLKGSLGASPLFSSAVAALAAQNASTNAGLTRHQSLQNFFVSPNSCPTSNADSLNFEYGGETAEARMVEYRGEKVAGFDIDADVMICLPQAYELFLKHLVGGLHTVYTKLKRLEITPRVCNVEQVRALRSLGAIQPGVNRCKLISCRDFDSLYNDCSNQSSRPGRPPKRSPVPYSPQSQNACGGPISFKKMKSEDDLATIDKHRANRGDHHLSRSSAGHSGGDRSTPSDVLGLFPGAPGPPVVGQMASNTGIGPWPLPFFSGMQSQQFVHLLQSMNPGLLAKMAAPSGLDLLHGNQARDIPAHFVNPHMDSHQKDDHCESPGLSGAEENSDCGAVNLSNRNQNLPMTAPLDADSSPNFKAVTTHDVNSLSLANTQGADSSARNTTLDPTNGGERKVNGQGNNRFQQSSEHNEDEENQDDVCDQWNSPIEKGGDKEASRAPQRLETLDLEGESSLGEEDEEERLAGRVGGIACAGRGNEVNYFSYVSELMTFLQNLLNIANITSQNQLEHLQREKWELSKKLHDEKSQNEKRLQELQQLKREKSIYRSRWRKEKRMRLEMLRELSKDSSPNLEYVPESNNNQSSGAVANISLSNSPSKPMPYSFQTSFNTSVSIPSQFESEAKVAAMTSSAMIQSGLGTPSTPLLSPRNPLLAHANTSTQQQQQQQPGIQTFSSRGSFSVSSPSTPAPPSSLVPPFSATPSSTLISGTSPLVTNTNNLVTTSHSSLASVSSFKS